MKGSKLMSSFVMIVLLLCGLVLPVAAQDGDTPGVNCNGLDEADCELLTDASTALQEGEIRSFTMPDWAIELNLKAGDETIVFRTAGSGRVVLPAAALALLSDMPQSFTAGGQYNLEGVIAFYESLDAESLLEMLQELGLELAITEARLQTPDQTLSGSAEVVFKDGTLYVRLESPAGESVWFGETLDITDAMVQELQATFDEMAAALQSPEMEDLLDQASSLSAAMMPLAELANAHVTTVREADAELSGQPVAVFTSTFDLSGFLTDPELPGAIVTLLNDPALAALSEQEMGIAINEAQVQFMLMAAGMIAGDTTFSSTVWVGLDDRLPRRLALDVTLDFDLSLLGDPEIPGLTGGLSFAVDMNQINSTTMDDVSVPSTYEPLERTSEFLAGGPDMVEGELTLGQTFSGGFTGDDEQDIYTITLDAGQNVQIELASDDYPYLTVYGPDGFEVAAFDPYFDDVLALTAPTSGTYFIEVKAYWELDYDLTIRAQ